MKQTIVGLFVTIMAALVVGAVAATPSYGQGDTVLGPDNAGAVGLIASYGKGRMLDTGWWDETTLVVTTTTGIWTYDISTASEPIQLVRFQTVMDGLQATVGPNRVAVGNSSGRVDIYNRDGSVATLQHPALVWRMAFSADGERLYVLADNGRGGELTATNLYQWDIATSEQLARIPLEPATYSALAVSADEQHIAVGNQLERLSMLSPETREVLWSYYAPETVSIYSTLTFTNDDKSLVAGVGGGVFVFDASDGTVLAHVRTNNDTSSTAVYGAQPLDSTNRVFVVAQSRFTFDPVVRGEFWVIDMVNQANIFEDNSGLGFHDQLSVSPDSQHVAYGGYDGFLLLYDVAANSARRLDTGYTASADVLALHPTQPLAATFGYDRMVNLWPLAADTDPSAIGASFSTGRTALRFDAASSAVLLASSDELYRMTYGDDLPATRTPLERDAQAGTIYGMRFAPATNTPQVLATSSSGLSFYTMDTVVSRTNIDLLEQVWFAALASDANVFAAHLAGDVMAIGTFDEALNVIEVKRSSAGLAAGIIGMLVSPDGQTILSAYLDGRIGVWTVNGDSVGVTTLTVADSDVTISSLATPPTSNGLAAAGTSDGRVLLVDTNTGIVRAILTGHLDDVTSVVFSANGTRLYSSSFDGRIMEWGIN